jgi:hypothetical protein
MIGNTRVKTFQVGSTARLVCAGVAFRILHKSQTVRSNHYTLVALLVPLLVEYKYHGVQLYLFTTWEGWWLIQLYTVPGTIQM